MRRIVMQGEKQRIVTQGEMQRIMTQGATHGALRLKGAVHQGCGRCSAFLKYNAPQAASIIITGVQVIK
jgi:hypothetical protein